MVLDEILVDQLVLLVVLLEREWLKVVLVDQLVLLVMLLEKDWLVYKLVVCKVQGGDWMVQLLCWTRSVPAQLPRQFLNVVVWVLFAVGFFLLHQVVPLHLVGCR